MLFWVVAGGLTALVAWLIARPLLLPGPEGEPGAPDHAIYRDQLAEVDRDLARGVLAPEEAERARTEIARRLLAADRAGSARQSEAPVRATRRAVAVVTATFLGCLFLYHGSADVLRSAGLSDARVESLKEVTSLSFEVRQTPVRVGFVFEGIGAPGARDQPRALRLAEAQALRDARPSQAEAEASARQAFPPPDIEPPADVAAALEGLRGADPASLAPGDWALLSAAEARLGRFAEAARAQERVVALLGEEASVEDLARLADLLVAAAGAVVTPEAEGVLAEIHARDPESLVTQLYVGLLEDQTGRPDLAFSRLLRVVQESPPGLHRSLAQGRIAAVAALAGVDYEAPAEADPVGMDPEAREGMIRGMVESLAARLAAEGGPASDWARLVTSLGVLGERERAGAILAEGREVFAGDEAAQALFDQAAQTAGLIP